MALTRGGISKGLLVVVLVLIVGAVVLWQRCGLRGCPDVHELAGYVPDEASVVLDHDGKEIGKLYLVQRVVVPLDSLPDYVGKAFVAVEDQRFWEHHGVDWRRVPGAVLANLRAGGVEQGFSTITMQLARNVFPEKLPAQRRTIWRKLGEMRVAEEIEDVYTKKQILSMYLNQIYFGNGAWGIEAASQEYFGRPASELTLAQAALLAGLPQAPSRDNPRSDRKAAIERRNVVLQKMAEQGMITAEQAEKARDADLDLAHASGRDTAEAPYFMDAVRDVLERQLGDAIYTGGYRIYTTLDSRIQRATRGALSDQLAAIDAGRYGAYRHAHYDPEMPDSLLGGTTPYVQGSAVVMEAATGNVLAMVGGRDYEQSKYNRATQAKRQPGSAFKPFVYATAIARGYPPTYLVDDTPLTMTIDGRTWHPQNYGNSYSGRIPMREALVHSKNVATIRLAEQVGLPNVISTAHTLGLSEDIPAYPSIVLGSVDVPLIEMVCAYAAFATLGERPEPRYVTRVEDRNGNVVWQQPVQSRQVLDASIAFVLNTMLEDVVNRGTATAVRAVGYRGTAAGKTGTTNDGTDAWFLGYTPRLVAGVWIGMDDPSRIVPGATGGELAAPVWGRIMARTGAGGEDWTPPPGVVAETVDEAGNVISEGCIPQGAVRREYFLQGTVAAGSSCYPAYYVDEYGDTVPYGTGQDEEGWWQRLKDRFFGGDSSDSSRLAELRSRADSLQRPDTANPADRRPGRDSLPPPWDTATPPPRPRADTTRSPQPPQPRDSMSPERDTIPPRPDTTSPARPDTTSPARPDTTFRPAATTTSSGRPPRHGAG